MRSLKTKPSLQLRAFTLAELLISLALLGVIATFTIPKILGSSQSQRYPDILKEDYTLLYNLLYDFHLSGESNIEQYVWNHINAVKLCKTNSLLEGCFAPYIGYDTLPGVILPNGSSIVFIFNSYYGQKAFFAVVDANGPALPNAWLEDRGGAWVANGDNAVFSCATRWVGYSYIHAPLSLHSWCDQVPEMDSLFLK
jgi:prepilin-type N-terminal cleavage/methylation domain-containing protein